MVNYTLVRSLGDYRKINQRKVTRNPSEGHTGMKPPCAKCTRPERPAWTGLPAILQCLPSTHRLFFPP